MVRQAVILAAGQGRRLWPHTKSTPKCLLKIGDKTILEHQIEALRSQGIDRIVVVTGYLGLKVREVLAKQAECVENKEFEETSSMYSLWLAREEIRGAFIVLNSDVLFHAGILKLLLACPHPDALAVDPSSVLQEEEMKVQLKGNRVVGLSKTFERADAENVGMLKFSTQGGRVLFQRIEELLRQNMRKVMVPYALNEIAPSYPLVAVSVEGLPWIEIDFPEDYDRARQVIHPAILKDHPTSGLSSGIL